MLQLTWIEQGAPPISKPQRLGTGSQLIDHSITDMEVVREFKSDGLVCTLTVPLVAARVAYPKPN